MIIWNIYCLCQVKRLFVNVTEIHRYGPHIHTLETIRICTTRNTRALTSRREELVLSKHMLYFKVESGSEFLEPSSMHQNTSKSIQLGIVAALTTCQKTWRLVLTLLFLLCGKRAFCEVLKRVRLNSRFKLWWISCLVFRHWGFNEFSVVGLGFWDCFLNLWY